MGKKKKNGAKRGGNRFFRWIRSDLPDEEEKKSPVLLLGVNKYSDSPSFVRKRSTDHPSGSIRFFRPVKSKYTRGRNEDLRLEKIRQDLSVHKTKSDNYIPKSHDVSIDRDERCLNLNCVGNCICERKGSNRGSFSFHRPEERQSSLCLSEPYKPEDLSEQEIEFKYTEHPADCQPSSSKQNSYNVTPKSVDRRSFLLSNLNERFRKTLSLDSRKIETNRVPLSLPKETRPKSLVTTNNIVQNFRVDEPFLNQLETEKPPKKKRKSFFSLETFFDSKKSDSSSVDDFCSSKYKRFELEDDSPLFRRENRNPREKTPDLLNLPVIIDSVRKKQSDTRKQLEKLENHYYKSLKTKTIIDSEPKDAKTDNGRTNHVFIDDDDVEYIEPIGSNSKSNFTSQSTLILDKNGLEKPESVLTIYTDETDIRLPSSTVSPKSDGRATENDLDSIGAYEIEVKESDLLKVSKELTVKVMDKSVDSIGSCSLDVDASTDFSDTTSGSLNLLTPSSTTSRIKEFNSRFQERANQCLPGFPTPLATPTRTPDDCTPTPKKPEHRKDTKNSDFYHLEARNVDSYQREARNSDSYQRKAINSACYQREARNSGFHQEEARNSDFYQREARNSDSYQREARNSGFDQQEARNLVSIQEKSRNTGTYRQETIHLETYKQESIIIESSQRESSITEFSHQESNDNSNHQQIKTPGISRTKSPEINNQLYIHREFKYLDPKTFTTTSDKLLKPPSKDSISHRSRNHHKKRDEKKPSYLNLACSVNGYTNLTTYDSKLRQDINKSREASPIRPITHTYHYRSENNTLLVPIPISSTKLLVPKFGPHDTKVNLTQKAPPKAHTDPYLATPHVFMAEENKQLKNNFLGTNMTTTSRPYISTESKNFASSMLHQDELDNTKEVTFKSSYSESNFHKNLNGKDTPHINSESYTISSNGVSKRVEITKENGEKLPSPMKSFIQQRVERLYGPGALAQGFLMQKRTKKSISEDDKVLTEKPMNYQSEYYSRRRSAESENTSLTVDDGNVSLPVLRHLRPEFRAQLPILSPKKSFKQDSPQKNDIPIKTDVLTANINNNTDANLMKSPKSEVVNVTNGVSVINLSGTVNNGTENGEAVKDANYFLALEKKETERLIALAVSAEKELENLQDNKDVSEEILGLLRSASGKARLLATQKMQQFEGLCYNNLNEGLDSPFPTTLEDLRGFWDMVCLQVRNVDALYAHIHQLKINNWQELAPPTVSTPTSSSNPRRQRAPPALKNEKARLAAEKREQDRKAMLDHRRRVARERQLALRATPGPSGPSGPSAAPPPRAVEGSQEVEIFVGKGPKPSKVAPKGDCSSTQSEDYS